MQTLNVDKWIFVVLHHKKLLLWRCFCILFVVVVTVVVLLLLLVFLLLLLFFFVFLLLLIEEFDSQSSKLAQNAFKCDEAAKLLWPPPAPSPRPLTLALHPQHFDELLMSLITEKASPTSSFKCSYLYDTNRNLSLWEFSLTLPSPHSPPAPSSALLCGLSRVQFTLDFDSRAPVCFALSGVVW